MAPDPAAAGPRPNPAAIRAAAHAILAQPQFRQPSPSPLDRLRHWSGQQIAHALAAVLGGGITLVGAIALLLLSAVVVWLVVRVARRVQADPTVARVVLGRPGTPPAEWLRLAGACEQRGDWRGALRARYRALVGELARRGLVAETLGRTTGEYRRDVGTALPGTAEDFSGATDLFELAVYGDQPTGPEQSRRLQELADHVLDAAR